MEGFPFDLPRRSGAPRSSETEYSMSRESALELADKVNQYWAKLGYNAEARVVEARFLDARGNTENFIVVSNLRNGIPARRLADAKH